VLWWIVVALLVLLVIVLVVTRTGRPAREARPPAPVVPLPADLQARVRQLVGEGKKILAIKEVREVLGLSLVDAKNAVDAIADGRSLPTAGPALGPAPGPAPRAVPDLADRARALAAAGRHDEAVRLVAAETGMSAPEAGAFIRALLP
jgi:large subunit ribosomal protein L7/L12